MSQSILYVFCLLVVAEAIIAVFVIRAVIKVKNVNRDAKLTDESARARPQANDDGPHDDGSHRRAAVACKRASCPNR